MSRSLQICWFCLIVAASLLFISPWGAFPLNDDWVYTTNVLETLATGTFSAKCGQFAWAIPQMLIGTLVASDTFNAFINLRWIGIISGVITAILLSCICIRELRMPTSPNLLLISTISTFFLTPYLVTCLSFMTDLPGLLLWVLSVTTLGAALHRKTTIAWIMAFLASTLAVAQRQQALAIPISMALWAICTTRYDTWKGWFREVWIQNYRLVFFAIPFLLIHNWWITVAPIKSAIPSFSANFLLAPGRFSVLLLYLGWTALPFLALPAHKLDQKQIKTLAWIILFFIMGLGFRCEWLMMPVLNNVLSSSGILPELLAGYAPIIFPDYLMSLLSLMGLIGAYRIFRGFTILITDSNLSDSSRLVITSSLLYFAVTILSQGCIFDRYILPIMPLSLICILRGTDTTQMIGIRRTGTYLLTIPYILFSTTLLFDYFRSIEARWLAIGEAHQMGFPQKQISGFYEYEGWVDNMPVSGISQSISNFHGQVFKPLASHDPSMEIVVSLSEFPGFKTLKRFDHSVVWSRNSGSIYLLQRCQTDASLFSSSHSIGSSECATPSQRQERVWTRYITCR